MSQHGGNPYIPPRVPLWQQIAYAPLYITLRCIAMLPPAATRPLASMLALMARDVIKYRKKIVHKNIALAFPEKTDIQRTKIEKQFYHHLCSYFFQTVRFRWMKPRDIKKHMSFSGLELLNDLFAQGKNIVLYTSHFGNWEYITPLTLWMPQWEDKITYAHVNRPLKNKWFNHFYHAMRSRFNISIPMLDVLRTIIQWRSQQHQFIMGFLSDQKPGQRTHKYTVPFLGIDTPFIGGTEIIARKMRMAAVYCDMSMPHPDKYHAHITLLTLDASQLPEGKLTQLYAQALTKTIHRQPALYLWSHNRWRLQKN